MEKDYTLVFDQIDGTENGAEALITEAQMIEFDEIAELSKIIAGTEESDLTYFTTT